MPKLPTSGKPHPNETEIVFRQSPERHVKGNSKSTYPQGSCERFHGCNDSPFPSFLARCQLRSLVASWMAGGAASCWATTRLKVPRIRSRDSTVKPSQSWRGLRGRAALSGRGGGQWWFGIYA